MRNPDIKTLIERFNNSTCSHDDLLLIAKNTNTPTHFFHTIFSIPPSLADTSTIHKLLAANPSVPTDILTKLSEDKSYDVRAIVAKNPSLPIDILTELSEDEIHIVRVNVVKNTICPAKILRELFYDKDKSVRKAATKVLRKRALV